MANSGENKSSAFFTAYAVGCMEGALGGDPGYSASAYVIRGCPDFDDPAKPQIFFSREPNRRVWGAVVMAIVGVVECPQLAEGFTVRCLVRQKEVAYAYQKNAIRRDGTQMADARAWERLFASRDRRGIALTVVAVSKSDIAPTLKTLQKATQAALAAHAEQARKLPPFPDIQT